MTDNDDAVRKEFEAATTRATTLPEQPDEVLLELYGLYKQATEGDVHGDEPGMFDFVGRAKWDAWSGHAGTTRAQAMQAYAARVRRLAGDET